ncbi:MAG: response regulator [Syntrophobacterales bacterium]|nr:MAG: response regulator [Syntrophobacterales bacterium]
MGRENIISGKKILIVDDEPDVLDTLEDILPMGAVERASDYQGAKALLESRPFDLAILDIMGVQGYDLLERGSHSIGLAAPPPVGLSAAGSTLSCWISCPCRIFLGVSILRV